MRSKKSRILADHKKAIMDEEQRLKEKGKKQVLVKLKEEADEAAKDNHQVHSLKLQVQTLQQQNQELEKQHSKPQKKYQKLQRKYQRLQKKNQKVLPKFSTMLCFFLFLSLSSGAPPEQMEMNLWKLKEVFVGNKPMHKNLSHILHRYHSMRES